MAQRLWDGTETLFTLVRFNRSLTRTDIARLAEQYLESESLKHDGLLATIGHYPEIEDLPPSDSPTSENQIDDSSDPAPDAPKGTLNDPAEWLSLYEGRLDGLKRDRSLNNFTAVRDTAKDLATRNEIDLDSYPHANALCRALLDADITITEEKLTFLRDIVLPHHPRHATTHRTTAPAPLSQPGAPATAMLRGARQLFSESWALYARDRVDSGNWKSSNERHARSTGRLFVEICGDKPLSAYGPADGAAFKRALLALPANYDKNIEWRDIQRTRGIRGLTEHCSGKPGIDRLKPQTFNRHLAALSGIWPWAQTNEVVAKGLPSIFEGLHINLKRTRAKLHRARDERPMWDQAELVAVLSAPLFTGVRSRRSWKRTGPNVLRDERYWGVLIGCHSGMRRGEIFQLQVRHVVHDAETGISRRAASPRADLSAARTGYRSAPPGSRSVVSRPSDVAAPFGGAADRRASMSSGSISLSFSEQASRLHCQAPLFARARMPSRNRRTLGRFARPASNSRWIGTGGGACASSTRRRVPAARPSAAW
ncbi:hypothetical protein AFCDBAGC_1118 [Methylobacterium cerastii]|uniref:Phage integrase family protein n=1 Tax=Methylobacterium cerastii TaxID=932741 RepID=A0ABQ4QES7_9HYPH|nr:hypothetical protein AFCDBAGC_1118 [Methylobacterium cerastii]